MKTLLTLVVAVLLAAGMAFASDLVTGGTKYKFEPGDKVLINYDFSQCPVGEAPQGFDEVAGVSECVEYHDHIWVGPSSASDLKLYKKIDLGHGDFSVEFSLVPHDSQWAWAVMELYKASPKGWHAEKIKRSLIIRMDRRSCEINLEGAGKLAEYRGCNKKPYHVAVQVRRGQFRVFVNGKRLTSVPFNLKKQDHISGFALMRVRGSHAYEALFSDIRVTRYSKKEAKPTPEKLGIRVEKTKEGLKLTVPERVLFDFNKFILKPEAKEALGAVTDVIRKNPPRLILVSGYTDNVGSEAYNLKLSLQRAQSVADYLMYCQNIDPDRFKIEGKGEADPIADNSNEEGRAKNRRVEIELLK